MDTNVLYYGDNLEILPKYVPNDSVDLVYLDPPFNSNQSYSAIFADESGRRSDAQIHAFEDQWHWGPTAEQHLSYLKNSALHQGRVPVAVTHFMAALEFGIGKTPMLAYLVEMTVRLVELHRVLKPTGSMYLHCDPVASHYLKLVVDAVFGPDSFRNEIIWKRTSAHGNASRKFGSVHDVLFFYTKGKNWTWNQPFEPYSDEYIAEHFVHIDPDGRRFRRVDLRNPAYRPNLIYDFKGYKPHPNGWLVTKEEMERLDREGRLFYPKKGESGRIRRKLYLDESPGVPVTDVWTDIKPIFATGAERLGYPTQKPLELLERIVETSSNPGDIVLDPFCGCGTATVAAQKLGRKWIGIDVTYLAVAVMRHRLRDSFPGMPAIPVIGQPTEVEGARLLATQGLEGRYQFQWWALDVVGAMPASGDQKKGSDQGIDGRITFTGSDGMLQQAIVSVKSSGKPGVDDVRVLKAVCERDGAAIGILVTLEEPTKPMVHEATIAGSYHSDVSDKDYPRIQIISVTDLLEKGLRPLLPPLVASPYQKAPKIGMKAGQQQSLFGSTEG